MMTGRLYIDGYDAYTTWGVYVVSGGWNDLISYPPIKSVESNDWHEVDGIEADLSDPKLNIKEATLRIACAGVYGNFAGFIAMLSDKAYHDFDCRYIGRRYTLRLTQMPNLDHANALGFVTLKLSNDYPLKDYTYEPPKSSIQRVSDYLIDGVPFTNYGVRILEGSLSEVMKTASVKQNLLCNLRTANGAIYDGATVTFKSKDVKLKCLMRAETLTELWQNYDALLFDLTRPNEHQLEVQELEQVFPCYYKSASVTDFYPDSKIWLEFTITLAFTNNFRIADGILLSTQDGTLVFTEDFLNSIDMTPTITPSISKVTKV